MNILSNHTPEVKKGLISLLMFQIYSEQRTIYREYVQNALDSINKAVEEHILNANKDGKVEIYINPNTKIVTIKDNGTGVKTKDAARTLLDISSSTKDGISQAGQFGIGRLVGGGYCHKLIFKTSAKGENVGTQVTFDVDKIWKLIKEDETDYLASYVISQCTTVEQFACDVDVHFFEVILDGIKDEFAPALLDKGKVSEYLTEVAPVEYASSFKNALIYSSLKVQPDYKDLFEKLDKVQVFVNSDPIKKKYGLTIKGTKDEINKLEFFKLEDPKYGLLAWGWFALTKFSIQIPKTDNLACIRLRKHNIQIGGSDQLSGSAYWKEERSNSYFYGELFVTHPNIMPNAARDGLAPGKETSAFNKLLKEYFEKLKALYTKANAAKKCVDKIKDGYERIKKNGIHDYNSKDLVDNKGIAAFNKLLKGASFGPTQRMLLLYLPSIEDEKNRVDILLAELEARKKSQNSITNVKPTSSNQQSSINDPSKSTSTLGDSSEDNTSQIAGVNSLSSNAEGQGNSIPSTSDSSTNQKPTLPFVGGSFNPIEGITTLQPTTTPLLGNKDIVAQLEHTLEPNEVFLVRRIFRVLNTYCPVSEHDQALVRSLQECIVKELSNG